MKWNIKKLLISLGIPLAVGGLSALVSGSMAGFRGLDAPPLTPPGWVFPVVWSILYLLMGYASYRVWMAEADPKKKKRAQLFYGAQLLFNFLWPLVFFRLELRLTAFWILIILWVLIFITMRLFYKIDERAGDLLLPYLLWVTFAGYLNLGFFLEN